MHAEISGTIDFREKTDEDCLARLRQLAETLPHDEIASPYRREDAALPDCVPAAIYDVIPTDPQDQFDVRKMLDYIIDRETLVEYKRDYGQTIVCGYARVGGFPVGILANQRQASKTKREGMQFGGVIYVDSADKAARFIMDCNQNWMPLVFLQDVMGFMVGKTSEQHGIIRAGAKLVNVLSNSRVPKITVITGGSYGAGNYAMCGKAFDPRFIFAWPIARYAVMGAKQAASTLLDVNIKAMQRRWTRTGCRRASRIERQGHQRLRRIHRYPLRCRPRLGRRHYRSRGHSSDAHPSAGNLDASRRRKDVCHGRAASLGRGNRPEGPHTIVQKDLVGVRQTSGVRGVVNPGRNRRKAAARKTDTL